MKALLPALLFTVLAGTATPQAVNPDIGIVEGFVRIAGTNEGVAGAWIALSGMKDDPNDQIRNTAVRTDSKGYFFFGDVPPDSYIVTARRDGFYWPGIELLSVQSEERFPVARGQRVSNVVLELVPLAIISGRVQDVDGEPLVGASVVAGQFYYDPSGRRHLELSGGSGGDYTGATYSSKAMTDDRGEYRMFQLKPGTYYVGIGPRTGVRPQVFFPGTFDATAATRIVAVGGKEVAGIDFRIPPLPNTSRFSISGIVAGHPELTTKPVETFHLISRDRRNSNFRSRNQSSDRSGGRFQIRGITAGIYDLYPEFRDAQGRLWTSRMEIEVHDRDIENVRVPLTSGADLRGRLVVDGTFQGSTFRETFSAYQPFGPLTDDDWATFIIGLESEENLPVDLLRQQSSAKFFVDPATGEFTLHGVPAGRYRLRLPTLANGAYFGDVQQGARSVFDQGVVIGTETPNPIEVVIKTDGVRLQGIVQDASFRPVPGAQVVLVPSPSLRLNSDRYRSTLSSKEGRFEFRTTPPGDYKVFAWSGIPFYAWRNADVMAAYESRGVSIHIGGVPPSPITVPLIPWTER